MKFKVGQKVRAKCDAYFNKGELLEIIKADPSDETYRCESNGRKYWQPESNLESLIPFQEKLDRFLKEPVGFLVKSKEIADELAKVFERKHMKGESGRQPLEVMQSCIGLLHEYKGSPWVSYNYTPDKHGLSYGNIGLSGYHLEFLDVTLDELKEYLESFPQTLEDKLELFKAGTHVLHTPTQEIYDKLMVELEKRGYKWSGADKPTGFNAYCGDSTCISYEPYMEIRFCNVNPYEKTEVLELTLEDFRMGNAHRVSDSEQEEHMKITIETDGHHKTTAECNGITAESLCNPTDEFKLPKGVHMAVQRLLEKLKEDTGFHLGDIVEVVANEFNFEGNPIGLQGIVEWSNRSGADVKLPTRDKPLTFYNRELKLIRRGNN